ncbi:TrmH family RNA methyltransferase [Patescibacteria group bacterium]|nr:TrmH family RNA methyltransferase [Patescibacteria group bacterium]
MIKKKINLILPDIRSCHNVGAMFRSADAFGVSKIYLVGYTPCPPKPQIDKVSLGAEKWVLWEKRVSLKRLISGLKKKGVWVVGLEKTDSSYQISAMPAGRQDNSNHFKNKDIALIVGNEVEGISDEILKLCDEVVHILMYGKKESLNVSVAAGIAMYEIRRALEG